MVGGATWAAQRLSLIGSQYIDWYRNIYPNRQYVVVGEQSVPWLFAGTGLKDGSEISGHFGIEIDGVAPSSPPHTIVLAAIPDIFPGETAQMTYYTTPAGAEVFNAGTIDFGGAAEIPDVSTMLLNLWSHMAGGSTARSVARDKSSQASGSLRTMPESPVMAQVGRASRPTSFSVQTQTPRGTIARRVRGRWSI